MYIEIPNSRKVQIIRPTLGEIRNEPLDAAGVSMSGVAGIYLST